LSSDSLDHKAWLWPLIYAEDIGICRTARKRHPQNVLTCVCFFCLPHEPGWRNWQTQRTQNPPGFGPWGFDSPSRHHLFLSLRSTPLRSIVFVKIISVPDAGRSARWPGSRPSLHRKARSQNGSGLTPPPFKPMMPNDSLTLRSTFLRDSDFLILQGTTVFPLCSPCDVTWITSAARPQE
jgi:hypothetical protein